MKSKKYLIILILKCLESNSDRNHPLTQRDIKNMISDVYDCDRKTVGRNIKFLKEIGYPIEKTSKGFYMNNKKFTLEEVDFIINAILSTDSGNIDKEGLIARLKPVLNKIYRS